MRPQHHGRCGRTSAADCSPDLKEAATAWCEPRQQFLLSSPGIFVGTIVQRARVCSPGAQCTGCGHDNSRRRPAQDLVRGGHFALGPVLFLARVRQACADLRPALLSEVALHASRRFCPRKIPGVSSSASAFGLSAWVFHCTMGFCSSLGGPGCAFLAQSDGKPKLRRGAHLPAASGVVGRRPH